MSEQIKSVDGIVGKTIATVAEAEYDGLLAVHFTDGSYVVLHGYSNYDTPTIEIVDDAPADYESSLLGIISVDEYKRRKAANESRDRERAEQQERAAFERLKRKYEPQT